MKPRTLPGKLWPCLLVPVLIGAMFSVLIGSYSAGIAAAQGAAPTAANPTASATGMMPGDIYTVVGNGARGCSGDGGPATGAKLDWSNVLALDTGNLYIADQFNDTASTRWRRRTINSTGST